MSPPPSPVRILCWNLFHGRSRPPSGRSLLGEFAERIAGWEWDVALLQEMPPRWLAPLCAASGAEGRLALTSRHELLPLRRAIAARAPDLARSQGGGANAVLVRPRLLGSRPLGESRSWRLRCRPERRVALAVALPGGGWVVNVHASTRRDRATSELQDLWSRASALPGVAEGALLILGGDLNLFRPPLPASLSVLHAGASAVDHVFVAGPLRRGEGRRLDDGAMVDDRPIRLSDHDPLLGVAC